MLAALLCNLTPPAGPILRKREYASVSKDVQKAANEIRDILFPSAIPSAVRTKVKRTVEKVTEIAELPEISPSSISGAIFQTKLAIESAQLMLADLGPQVWFMEMQQILIRLSLIETALNDDEEALLLLM